MEKNRNMVMKSSRKRLGHAAFAATLMSLAVANVTQAQSANENEETSKALEEVVVTGTRIQGQEPVGFAVTKLGREDIENSGEVSIDRILREMPQVYNLGVSEDSRGQSGGAANIAYGNSPNIHGIGPYATLVLIDGHRVVNNSRSIDPSVMPTLGVSAIDVIADGASAIYGSDAVAGIVNLLPRRDLDGMEAFARYGAADSFDTWSAGFAVGRVWEGGQAMFAFEHAYRSNLNTSDRDFYNSDLTSQGGPDYRTTSCEPGTITAGGTTYAIPSGGLTAANAGSLVAGTKNLCNSVVGQDFFPEQEYDSASFTFTQNITDNLTFFADGFFSDRNYTRLPGQFEGSATVSETSAFYVPIPGHTGPYTVNFNLGPDSNFAAFGSATSWQVTPGLRYNIDDNWVLEARYGYGETRDDANEVHNQDRGFYAAAVGSSDPANALDLLGGGRTTPATLNDAFDQIFLAPTYNDFTMYSADLSGTLFEMNGRDVGLAVGYAYAEDDLMQGTARGPAGTPPRFAERYRDVSSFYGELTVPLASNIDVNVAMRSDDYSDVGSTTNPKFGINWAPTDALKLRLSYGESFRAPLITQIYGNTAAIYQQAYFDPTTGSTVAGLAESGPNLELKPETAQTLSVGFDWDIDEDTLLSMTYWSVDYTNQVAKYLQDRAILSREAIFEGTGIIKRGAEAKERIAYLASQGYGTRNFSPGFATLNAETVELYVDGRDNNLGASLTEGIDFNFRMNSDTDFGAVTYTLAGTYLTTYESAVSEAAPMISYLNTMYNPLKMRLRGGASLMSGSWTYSLMGNYVGSYTNDRVTPNESVEAFATVDFGASYSFADEKGLTVSLDVRNLFDKAPPYINMRPSGLGGTMYDSSAASPLGRVATVSLRYKL